MNERQSSLNLAHRIADIERTYLDANRWCGILDRSENTDPNSRTRILTAALVARFHDGTPTRRLKVTSYEYTGDTVTMYWLYKGEKLYTEFSEFSADGRTMAQLKGESGTRIVPVQTGTLIGVEIGNAKRHVRFTPDNDRERISAKGHVCFTPRKRTCAVH